jgi:hypothetical protein
LHFAVDDAVDLAARFVALRLILPNNVRMALSGEPVKARTRQSLTSLLQAGAVHLGPSRNRLIRQLHEIAAAGESGYLFLTLSTRGYCATDSDAILCQDTVLDFDLSNGILRETSLSHPLLLSLVERQTRCRRRIVLIDAYSEDLERQAASIGVVPRQDNLLRIAAKAHGTAVLLASAAGSNSYESPELQNGVFTHCFLQGLETGTGDEQDGLLTIGSLANYTNQCCLDWVKKHRPDHKALSRGISTHLDPKDAEDLPLGVIALPLTQSK